MIIKIKNKFRMKCLIIKNDEYFLEYLKKKLFK